MYILVCLLFHLFCNAFAIPAIQTNPINDLDQEAIKETNNIGDALLKEIHDLERQKGDLYKEINKAIEESITALKKSNDSDAIIGVNYITDLKKQMKEFNDTDDTADVIYHELDKTNKTSTFLDKEENVTIADTRRRKNNRGMKKTERQPGMIDANERYLQEAQKELDRLLHKGLTGEKLKERLERREKIRAQLEEWIKMKDLERKKIREYRDSQKKKLGHQEECPRTGYSRQKKKSKKGNYPCCRKCCKRSYMGCLKK